ncbi:MAG: AMMECR1 domain-containing protein [Phycisphaerae bacterium]
MVHKLSFVSPVAVVLFLAHAAGASATGEAGELDAPAISEIHRSFLSRIARRTIRDAILGRAVYEPGYVPATLESHSNEVVVRLRQRGYLLGAGAAGPAPLAHATRDAATAAFAMIRGRDDVDIDLLNDLLIEIEVVGRPQPLDLETNWTAPRAVDKYVEPGVHGIVLLGPKARHRLLPTDIVTGGMTVADALKEWAQAALADPSCIPKTQLLRFRTVHWYETPGADSVVSLHRGLTPVSLESVSPKDMDAAIDALAEYMRYRQLASGLFTYQYEPAIDRYSDENNLVRQVGATAAMALHAAWSGKSASLAAADIGIRYHRQGLVELPDVLPDGADAAFVATADGENKLGVTALLCVAMSYHPRAQQFAFDRARLVNGMLWLQRPSGMLMTSFPPSESVKAQDYFPGEALLAMALQYSEAPSGALLDAFSRAISFYRGLFRDRRSPAFVPWQTQAYAIMAKHTKRRDFVDYVFELTDWLARKQLTPANCEWPEMWGGIASYERGRAGVSTASYLEGFADALKLARDIGDAGRAEKYETLVRNAARFVMQLQVRPEEAYYVRSRQDAVGGIRTTPALNLLRIDHCQHALIGLIKARQVLFPRVD